MPVIIMIVVMTSHENRSCVAIQLADDQGSVTSQNLQVSDNGS